MFDIGGRIADPVHGYIDFTGIEREILKSRVTQRLRHVAQNGLAQLVFPEAVTTRFSHSLGAMHLSSGFLASILRNADSNGQDVLTGVISSAVATATGPIADPLEAAARVNSHALLASGYCPFEDRKAAVALIEQALRLAALFHDLGHLPLSHDFEIGLEDYWHRLPRAERAESPLRSLMLQATGEAKVHERVGHMLALLLFRDQFGALNDPADRGAAQAVFTLAFDILEAPGEPANPSEVAFHFLHSLIDGDLDVDRCDYILRDARNHGFEFASYDLSRLLDNLTVAGAIGGLVLAIQPHGLTAVESFFMSRYRSHQNGVRHHKVAQVGAAARYAVGLLLSERKGASLEQFKKDLAHLMEAESMRQGIPEFLRRFAAYDDIWWMNLVREQGLTGNDEWLDLIAWRSPGPTSLWKRIDDFPRADIRAWNRQLPDPDDADAEERLADVRAELANAGVLLVRHYFQPWRSGEANGDEVDSRLCVASANRDLIPATRHSPLMASLRRAWERDIQVQAFARSDSQISREDVIDAVERVFA